MTIRSETGTETGKVYLVGAGPGAVDLLTLRAARLLEQADIVFHDALVSPEILALASKAVLMPVGKRCGKLSSSQQFINRQLLQAVRRHRTVVRLKGGDPMLFGRAQEEIDYLAGHGVAVEVVPGISAAFGASASIGRSLTRRGLSRNVVFATPATGQGQRSHGWARTVCSADTVVLYMASRQVDGVSEELVRAGVSATRPAVLIENATLPEERVWYTTVGQLPEAARNLGEGPALMLIGEVYETAASSCVPEPTNTVWRVA